MISMIINFLICLLIGFLIGYKCGFFLGERRGLKIAEAKLPLKILEKSIKLGHCLICNGKIIYTGRNSEDDIEVNNNR